MGFLNSILLWSGLGAAGVAVPILIHFFYRKHRRVTKWAAMELLRRALVIRSSQIRIEDLIILVLRCLVLALVALAMVRPTLRRDASLFAAGQQRVGVVVAIDSSYSMSHGQFRKRYDKAVERAGIILSTLREGDPVSVVLMGARPRILIRSTGYNQTRFTRLLSTETKVLAERLNQEQNLEELERLVGELKTPVRECYIVTDGQAGDWENLSDGASATMKRIGRLGKTYLVPVELDGEENVAISSLTYASGSLRRNGTARFAASIVNHGRRPRDAGPVIFSVDGEEVSKKPVGILGPGQTRVVSFFSSFTTDGDVRISAALGPDDLAQDNRRQAEVTVRSAVRVLCVTAAKSAQDRSPGTAFYVERALMGKASVSDASIQVVCAEWQDLDNETLVDYDVVILADVADLSEGAMKKLDQFVRRGGGLMVFAGDKVTAETYNNRLRTSAGPLLPVTLDKDAKVPAREGGWALGRATPGHQISDLVRLLPAELLDSVRFQRVLKVTPNAGAVTLLALAGQDMPLLVEHQVGKGSVLFFACTADAKWGNFPTHPLYPILLQQAVTGMSSHPGRRTAIVGQTVTVPVGKRLGDSVKLTAPAGQARDLKVTAVDGQPSVTFEPEVEGFHKLETGKDQSTWIAINLDPRESDVKELAASMLAQKAAGVSMAVILPGENLAAFVKNGRNGIELARILLVAALVLFLLQSWLARRFTHRITRGLTDVVAEVSRSRTAGARRVQAG